MSWHFSQALVEAYLGGNCSAGVLFAPWSSMTSAPDDSCSAKMRGTCHLSPFGIMFVPSTDILGEEVLTWFRQAFPARTSARLGAAADLMGHAAVYGEKHGELLARYDRDSASWRTPPTLLDADWTEFSGTWPRWGMMRDGACFRGTMSEQSMRGRGGIAWLTPTVEDFKRRGSAKAWTEYQTTGRTTCARLRNQVQNQPDGEAYLTPEFAESLMWWPIGWTGVAQLATDRYPQWLDWHGKR